MIDILPENPTEHADTIEALYDLTFGPGHFAKTAERLREYSSSLPHLSRVAMAGADLAGVCRVWPLEVEAGPSAVFIGPVAVHPDHRGDLLSARMTQSALDAARLEGWGAAILIGALSLFGKAGFRSVERGQLALPGPVDPARLLVCDLAGDASALSGRVTAPRVARPRAPVPAREARPASPA